MNAALVGLLGLAVALAALRLVRGPGDADRIVALDLLSACGVAACVLAAAQSGQVLYLDVALGGALVAFVGTLAWARAVARKGDRRG